MRNGYAEYGIPTGYYDRDGNPMPLKCWANVTGTPYTFVARTEFGPDEYVLTVWTGVPMPMLTPPPGLIFATLVNVKASELNGHQWWCSSLEDAITRHDMIALSVAHELAHP